MKVSRLPIDPGPAAWADLLPLAAPPQKLEGAQTADWLVIGGGFAPHRAKTPGSREESTVQVNRAAA